jgi:hypothetical protein
VLYLVSLRERRTSFLSLSCTEVVPKSNLRQSPGSQRAEGDSEETRLPGINSGLIEHLKPCCGALLWVNVSAKLKHRIVADPVLSGRCRVHAARMFEAILVFTGFL